MTLKRWLPLVLILLFVAVSYWVWSHPPEVQRSEKPAAPKITVDTQRIQAHDYRIRIDSYGLLEPRTQVTLQPQVSGEIVWVAPQFEAGGFFDKGETLLRIDDRDYQTAVAQARAALASARQTLTEEQARGEQAVRDWQRLGHKSEAPLLVRRQPQLAAARASVVSAQAVLKQAQLDLERTRIKAPFSARVLAQSADLGQVVTTSTELATIYAIDQLQVRLPLKSRDLPFVDLPERLRKGVAAPVTAATPVELLSDIGGQEERWQAELVQTEGAIDSTTRQLHVLARIEDPYGEKAVGRAPLKVGQYVEAVISGKTLSNAIVIPNAAIYQGSYVFLVQQGVLQRTAVKILWQNADEAVIAAGLNSGDELVTTVLGQVLSGTAVEIKKPDNTAPQESNRTPTPESAS